VGIYPPSIASILLVSTKLASGIVLWDVVRYRS
jgi:hypothetical protein